MEIRDFSNRIAVVTAGGGAICGAVCRQLGFRGTAVAVWDIDSGAAEAVAAEIRSEGSAALSCRCDCADTASVKAALSRTVAELGRPTLLVNGAGGSRKTTTTSDDLRFSDIDSAAIDATVRLNYKTAVVTSQVVLPSLIDEGGSDASIVNIASVAGLLPLSRATTYSDSKAAVVSFTRWLSVHIAREYTATVRVNAVAPGFVLTEQNRFLLLDEKTGEPTERGRDVLSAVPMARYGDPVEIAEAVVWLLSPAARFVTGAVLAVDGGFSADCGV